MIIPRYKLGNRAEKRLFNQEANKVLKPLMQIEATFFDYLFDENQKWSYRALFHVFKDQYAQAAERLSKGKKMLEVDLDYFIENYKPIENAN